MNLHEGDENALPDGENVRSLCRSLARVDLFVVKSGLRIGDKGRTTEVFVLKGRNMLSNMWHLGSTRWERLHDSCNVCAIISQKCCIFASFILTIPDDDTCTLDLSIDLLRLCKSCTGPF